MNIDDLNIKIFWDGCFFSQESLKNANNVQGYTTNPSLMRKEGVLDYESYAKSALLFNKPISFEVFSDDLFGMVTQARRIASWGDNVYAKIPITDTKGNSTYRVVETLSSEGIKLNITAIFTADQVMAVEPVMSSTTPAIISVFAGRIADTGIDPVPILQECKWLISEKPNIELLWASCREIYNIFQADKVGCDIITVPEAILRKLHIVGTNLEDYSRLTIQEFYDDAVSAGYEL